MAPKRPLLCAIGRTQTKASLKTTCNSQRQSGFKQESIQHLKNCSKCIALTCFAFLLRIQRFVLFNQQTFVFRFPTRSSHGPMAFVHDCNGVSKRCIICCFVLCYACKVSWAFPSLTTCGRGTKFPKTNAVRLLDAWRCDIGNLRKHSGAKTTKSIKKGSDT